METITQEYAHQFSREWINAWNAHDLDRVLSHYADDFEMSSPMIIKVAGEPSGRLRGAETVRAYWSKALQMLPDLHFDLIAVLTGVGSIALHYRASDGRLALEVFHFGPHRKIEKAFAHYEAVSDEQWVSGDDAKLGEKLQLSEDQAHGLRRNMKIFRRFVFHVKENDPGFNLASSLGFGGGGSKTFRKLDVTVDDRKASIVTLVDAKPLCDASPERFLLSILSEIEAQHITVDKNDDASNLAKKLRRAWFDLIDTFNWIWWP